MTNVNAAVRLLAGVRDNDLKDTRTLGAQALALNASQRAGGPET